MSFFSRLGLRLAMISVFVGAACTYSAWDSYVIASKTKEKPTSITAAQLSASGPPSDNAFLHVTNFDVNPEYIRMTKKHDENVWVGAWLQILPAGTAPSKSSSKAGKPIILQDDSITSEVDLDAFSKNKSFDAIVCNGVTSISPPDTPTNITFPDINLKDDWVLKLTQRSDYGQAITMAMFGFCLMLMGAAPFLRGLLRGRQARVVSSSSTSSGSSKKW